MVLYFVRQHSHEGQSHEQRFKKKGDYMIENPQLARCIRYRALKRAKAMAVQDGDPEVIKCISDALSEARQQQTINHNSGVTNERSS